MRAIFINRYFHPDTSATSQMLSGVAFGLAAQGQRVTVITSRLDYSDASKRYSPRETVQGVEIVRVWTSGFGRAGLIGRAVDYATFYLSAMWAVLRHAQQGDAVISKTDPPMLGVLTGPAARLKRAHAVNWLQDLFPEVAVGLGMGTGAAGRAFWGTLRWLRDRSLRRAALTVVIGERMAALARGRGVGTERIALIPNWADEALIAPVPPETNMLRAEWGLTDRFVVGYSGNLGRAHDFATFVDAIAAVEGKAAAGDAAAGLVKWLFVGGGASRREMQAEVQKRGLTSVLFKDYQPADKLAQSLGAADVHLVTLKPAMEGLIVPSKYYGILAAGRPSIFIGASDGELAVAMARDGTGLHVAEGDAAALGRAVLALAADGGLRARMGVAAHAAHVRDATRAVAVTRWATALAALGTSG